MTNNIIFLYKLKQISYFLIFYILLSFIIDDESSVENEYNEYIIVKSLFKLKGELLLLLLFIFNFKTSLWKILKKNEWVESTHKIMIIEMSA